MPCPFLVPSAPLKPKQLLSTGCLPCARTSGQEVGFSLLPSPTWPHSTLGPTRAGSYYSPATDTLRVCVGDTVAFGWTSGPYNVVETRAAGCTAAKVKEHVKSSPRGSLNVKVYAAGTRYFTSTVVKGARGSPDDCRRGAKGGGHAAARGPRPRLSLARCSPADSALGGPTPCPGCRL